ncbi:hypothetical protein [Erwinia phyllosphaerae]|uniref:hypothetical protein n=1 Tax=Erwinia phyllosphaerae TaxID=2853256 RepID=UPI001FF04A2F|nr:hypothetical protein [Erwinia phyllosphaerae]MBV4367203.1 hypothetical protein [Erwinia phyllosphaerae]
MFYTIDQPEKLREAKRKNNVNELKAVRGPAAEGKNARQKKIIKINPGFRWAKKSADAKVIGQSGTANKPVKL